MSTFAGAPILKRRLFVFAGLSSAATALGIAHFVSRKSPPELTSTAQLTYVSNPTDVLLRFVVIGDVGTGQAGQYAVAQAMETHWQSAAFPLVLMLGDNIYNNGEIGKISRAFERPYAPLLANQVEFRAALGNHDFRTHQGNDQVAYPGYNMPARYYTFTQGPVQFFALDTNQTYLRQKTDWLSQLQWLREELSESTATWKVVFAHHTIYSSGRHGSDPGLIKDLQPIFKDHGVQLYLNGHDHHYERTQPLDGTTYITSGNGAKLRSVGSSPWTAYASSNLGFTLFDVYSDHMSIHAIGTDNAVFDHAHI